MLQWFKCGHEKPELLSKMIMWLSSELPARVHVVASVADNFHSQKEKLHLLPMPVLTLNTK